MAAAAATAQATRRDSAPLGRRVLLGLIAASSVVRVAAVDNGCETLNNAAETHGTWSGSTAVGGTYTLRCHSGYHVASPDANGVVQYNVSISMSCPGTKHWTEVPRCKEIRQCDSLIHGCGAFGVCKEDSSRREGYRCVCESGKPLVKAINGEPICGSPSCHGRASCGAHGVCVNLENPDDAFDSGDNTAGAGYRCVCEDGYTDDGETCVPVKCDALVDSNGVWSGNTSFGEDYVLRCNPGATIRGGFATLEMTSCSANRTFDDKPWCFNPFREAEDARIATVKWWIAAGSALACVCCAALAAGLTMGLVSLEHFDMELLMTTKVEQCETKEEVELLRQSQAYAKKVEPLLKDHHLLLVTLLLLNSIANEALPIFLDEIMRPWMAILVSVCFVLFFGEILPSAIFTGPAKLRIAATLSPLVRCLEFLFYIIAKPIALLLDKVIGEEGEGPKYNKAQLSAILELHSQEGPAERPEDRLLGPREYTDKSTSSSDSSTSTASHPWWSRAAIHPLALCLAGTPAKANNDHRHLQRELRPVADERGGEASPRCLRKVECSLAQRSLRLQTVSLKELLPTLSQMAIGAGPGRPPLPLSEDLPVCDAIEALLREPTGTHCIVGSSGKICSLEGLLRAALLPGNGPGAGSSTRS